MALLTHELRNALVGEVGAAWPGLDLNCRGLGPAHQRREVAFSRRFGDLYLRRVF